MSANYGAKLAIRIIDADGNEVLISPLESFTPSISTPQDIIHSTEEERLGFGRGPTEFSFSFTVKSIGLAAKECVRIQLEQQTFELGVAEENTETGDWSFTAMLYSSCKITNSGPSAISQGGIPVSSFDAVALDATFDEIQNAI